MLVMAKINNVILNWSFNLIFFFPLSQVVTLAFPNNVEFTFQLGCVVFFAGNGLFLELNLYFDDNISY